MLEYLITKNFLPFIAPQGRFYFERTFMKFYDSIEFVPPTHPFLDDAHEYSPVNLKPLCRAAALADMLPLRPQDILSHPLGIVAVGVYSTRGHFELADALAYAGITKFEEHDGTKMALIGGMVTKRNARGAGLAHATLSKLLTASKQPDFLAEHAHEGFMARCNDSSVDLFRDLGFVPKALLGSRTVMERPVASTA